MCDFFIYNVNGKEFKLFFSTNWSIEISFKIKPKLKIKNDYDLARYILYYSQVDYKNDNRISFNTFKEINKDSLELMFCNYLISDKEFLLQNKISNVSNIQEGISELKRNIFERDKQLNLLMTASLITFQVEHSWMQSLRGKFSQEELINVNNAIKLFDSELLPKIKSIYEANNLLKYIEDFPTTYNNDYFNHLFKVSSSILRLTNLNFWIPSRFAQAIWNQIVLLKYDLHDDENLLKELFYYFSDVELKIIADIWCHSELLSVKSNIIEEIFFCFNQNKFYSTIVLGLTIIDFMTHKIYILTEGAKSKFEYTNYTLIDELKEQINSILGSSYSSDYYPNNTNFQRGLKLLQIITLTNYLRDTLFCDIEFDLIKDSSNILNRHSILHGKLSNFGTKENALRIIILIDDLLEFYNNYINKPK
jgi:hypothetical protein